MKWQEIFPHNTPRQMAGIGMAILVLVVITVLVAIGKKK